MPYPDRPHFAFPFGRNASGQVGVVEQGSEEHIMACVQVIAYCPLGYRDERPEFGWPWPDLQLMPIDPAPLIGALEQFEPRAKDISVADAQAIIHAAAGIDDITVDVQIQSGDSTGASEEDD